MAEPTYIREFEIDNIRQYCSDGKESYSFLIIGGPGTGKTTFIDNLIYYNRDKFPVAKGFMGNAGVYEEMKKKFHPLYMTSDFDMEELRSVIKRQKACIEENGEKHEGNRLVLILDDISADTKMYKKPEIQSLIKIGSRNWCMNTVVSMQYAIDVPSNIRSAFSFIVLFQENSPLVREKLYKLVGCGTMDEFNALMDAITGDYTAMIVNNRSQSNKLHDRVMYFRTINMGSKKWKFGCDEYHEWAKARYNKNYSDNFADFA